KALSATSIAGGFLVFLYEKNWLEAIIKAFGHQPRLFSTTLPTIVSDSLSQQLLMPNENQKDSFQLRIYRWEVHVMPLHLLHKEK
ncbi:hypothetical protein P7J42_07170, partial [Streptococcus suis]